VAEYYRESFIEGRMMYDGELMDNDNPKHLAALSLYTSGGDVERTKSRLNSAGYTEAAKLVKSGEEKKVSNATGRLYTVDIPEDSEMLDWDKPLKDQG
jgi:hypothetical protein